MSGSRTKKLRKRYQGMSKWFREHHSWRQFKKLAMQKPESEILDIPVV